MSVAVNMESSDKPLKVALIAGPTASGKSALALRLAEYLPATLINMDASQVYRDLRVLSARPSEAEEEAAPHRLFGYLDGAESCSAARWATDAKAALAESAAEGRLPILVGGTGLYMRTLLDGIAPVPEIDPQIRADIRALSREDPAAAVRLSPNDSTRVARALEVVRSTGRTLADWQKAKVGGIGDQVELLPLILLPPRDWLYARCDQRFAQMVDAGLDEVSTLLARELNPDLPVMRAIGVPELADHLAGRLSRDAALAAAQMATRNYAKRQFTWFRNQPPADWPRHEDELDVASVDKLAIILRDQALT
jgi:tRNA dimethylallyltransferase